MVDAVEPRRGLYLLEDDCCCEESYEAGKGNADRCEEGEVGEEELSIENRGVGDDMVSREALVD